MVAVAASLLAGCQPRDDGKTYLFNETGETGLTVVVTRPDGHRLEGGGFGDGYSFDTQFPDRDLQCCVGSDGSFEVTRADGSVVVHHDFADRQVCEREEITLGADGELVWSE